MINQFIVGEKGEGVQQVPLLCNKKKDHNFITILPQNLQHTKETLSQSKQNEWECMYLVPD